jgi:hypothetical protein
MQANTGRYEQNQDKRRDVVANHPTHSAQDVLVRARIASTYAGRFLRPRIGGSRGLRARTQNPQMATFNPHGKQALSVCVCERAKTLLPPT